MSYSECGCPVCYWENPGGSNVTNDEVGNFTLGIVVGQQTCQLFIYFDIFEIDGPTDGKCVDCKLTITGHNDNQYIPILCGNLNQQSSESCLFLV